MDEYPSRRRLGRALRIGASSTRASTEWAAASVLKVLGQGARARALQLSSSARVAAELGAMKGLAMKVGQYLSFALPDLPPELRDALAILQTSSVSRSFESIAAVIEAELGQPIERAYASFERAPMAAASIGQVHRASLADGTPVAVKIQYPDVADAVRADLANAALLSRSLRMLVPGLDAEGIATEIRARILEELDYRAEARWQAAFAERYRGHPFVAIPRVFPSHSSGQVLTTEYAAGRNFPDILGDPAPLRARHGEILFRFLLGSVLTSGVIVADPHPGNYRFDARGERTTFLDFGCVKALLPPVQAALRELYRGVLEGNRRLVRGASEHLGVVVGPDGQAVVATFSRLYVPFTEDRPTSFPPLFSGSARGGADGASFGEIRRHLRVPGELPFLNRTVLGLYAVLQRLGATANWYRIASEYACGASPSTELGEAEQKWLATRRAA